MGCQHSQEEKTSKVDLAITDDKRACTDVLCLLFYVIAFLAFIGIGIAGFVRGGMIYIYDNVYTTIYIYGNVYTTHTLFIYNANYLSQIRTKSYTVLITREMYVEKAAEESTLITHA